jgi:hypothetical protein
MQFLLATPEYNNLQSNTTKVRVHLRNGVAEVFDQHQDLMGKVDNNIIEIETNFENRIEKILFVLQDAVFIVSNQGLDINSENNKGTGVYVYAKRAKEITPNISLEEISKQYEQKQAFFEAESIKLAADGVDQVVNSKLFVLKDEVEFLKKVVTVVKELKS